MQVSIYIVWLAINYIENSLYERLDGYNDITAVEEKKGIPKPSK